MHNFTIFIGQPRNNLETVKGSDLNIKQLLFRFVVTGWPSLTKFSYSTLSPLKPIG
jgi:hypothetical protein